eukprot:CAMPEP_0183725106 /NCGR_PEP_ID=MMETSP0737-20130205/19623_1 /TAXON_ID=385413 /ORGANISM="Thalassiosira miniscula, Strain CCMP1093" /LENGTH=90 /DNA_ID=CAMNT_0025955935 /DNA_START=181 /DNA_END=450 /DNA_ORIENTATION=-
MPMIDAGSNCSIETFDHAGMYRLHSYVSHIVRLQAPAIPVFPTANKLVPGAWCWCKPKPLHIARRAAVIIGIDTNLPPIPARLPNKPAND